MDNQANFSIPNSNLFFNSKQVNNVKNFDQQLNTKLMQSMPQMSNSISLNNNLNKQDFFSRNTSTPKTPTRLHNSLFNTCIKEQISPQNYDNLVQQQKNMPGYGIEKCGQSKLTSSKFLSKSPYSINNNFNKAAGSGNSTEGTKNGTNLSGLFERKGTSRNSFSKRYLNNIHVILNFGNF